MRFYIWTGSAEEGACVGLKPDLQEGTGFNLLRVQFWSLFWHLHCRKFVEAFISSWSADLISSSCGWNLELFEALIANLLVILCDVDAFLHWNSSAERRCLCGLKTGPPRRHRIQPVEGSVLDPLAKETCFQKGSKSGPLEIKSGPPWRVQFWSLFWHLHCRKFVEAFILSWSWFDQQQLRLESWTGEAHFCAPAFSYVLRTKTGTFFVTLFSPISIALTASRPASKLAPKCFVLIPMVSRRWSSRFALRPASNYTSSSKPFCLAAISISLRPRGLRWGRLFAPAAA